MNKAFAEPTLAKFNIALSAAAIHPNLTIKRESDAGEHIVRVTLYDQKLTVQFDRRGKAIWYDKQIRHVRTRKFKDVVEILIPWPKMLKYLCPRRCTNSQKCEHDVHDVRVGRFASEGAAPLAAGCIWQQRWILEIIAKHKKDQKMIIIMFLF